MRSQSVLFINTFRGEGTGLVPFCFRMAKARVRQGQEQFLPPQGERDDYSSVRRQTPTDKKEWQ